MEERRIEFDEHFRTFRLYPGRSLYAFCISPEMDLEHLYWGKRLSPGFDLRYLSQSTRMLHFNTTELIDESMEDSVNDSIISDLRQDSIETLQETWKRSKTSKFLESDLEAFKQRRIENMSWRLMGKLSLPQTGMAGSGSGSEEIQEMDPDGLMLILEDPPTSSTTAGTAATSPFVASPAPSDVLRRTTMQSSPIPSQMPTLVSPTTLPPPAASSAFSMPFSPISGGGSGVGSGIGSGSVSGSGCGSGSGLGSSDLCSNCFQLSSPSISKFSELCLRCNTGRPDSRRAFERRSGKIGKGNLNLEYSDLGTGDFRTPSFVVVDTHNGSSISPLRYKKHEILDYRLPLPDHWPGVRCKDGQASTLVVTMEDTGSGLEVDLVYLVLHDYDAITRRAIFRNHATRRGSPGSPETPSIKIIQRASSFSLDYESTSTPFYMVQLSGSWGRERHVVETKLTHGIQSFGSVHGVSGHQHNPFAAISVGPPNETNGETKGYSLIYSGNFIFEAQLSEMGRLRINMGVHPMGFQWYLKPDEPFHTPEAILVRSSEGLGGVSRVLHRVLRNQLIAPLPDWAKKSPPVLLNTWEAKYFNVNHAVVLEMAKQASKLGVDLIVVDDGWFGKRTDDTKGLGDWFPDPDKFPDGLEPLVKEVNALGCHVGLWFEPEMVSEQSQLFQKNSNWHLRVPGRPRQVGRNQMVLDLSRKEIRDYLFEAISKVLRSANIEYVKWDMNRPLTEVFSTRKDAYQSETSFRYVLGLYELQHRITKAFPNILIENCASGGGRFDPGMLYFSQQIWCSDNTDAIARMKIQYGTSLAYPASCIGSHVSTIPNHITGNSTRARTRGLVAMCGTFGFELDPAEINTKERALFREMVQTFRTVCPIIRAGEQYRLWDPFKSSFAAWMYVLPSKDFAVVFAFSMNSDHWSNLVPRLILQGLEPEAEYEITELMPNNIVQASGNLKIEESDSPNYQLGYNTVSLPGDVLMNAGLPVKFYSLDDSVMFLLVRVCGSSTGKRSLARCKTIQCLAEP